MMSQSATGPADGDAPRSRRMGILPLTNLPLSITESIPSYSSPPATPPLPPRSPLRPRTRTISNGTHSIGAVLQPIVESEGMTLLHSRSLGAFPRTIETCASRPKTPEKPLPLPPSPIDVIDEEDVLPKTPARSKRTHALNELLETERAYASDMAVLRDIYLPLALGQSVSLHAIPQTPPSSASSSRTMSIASDDSTGSKPPMTREDAKIIFNNVADLAEFADSFTVRLEEALGSTLEGGKGEDHVGALFLEAIPTIDPIYLEYITKHPTALDHLNKLPQSPQLTAYLENTRRHAQHYTNAWDLPSLLIKPVQRLLKYSLLLAAIIDETPDEHGDKQNLRDARAKMDHVAQGVNEGRRRREVVKELLSGVPGNKGGEPKLKRKGLNLSVATSVSLGKMRGLKPGSFKVKEGADGNKEAESVARMGEELKKCETFVGNLAKDTKNWSRTVTILMQKLINWTVCFGRVLGISEDQKSEAFEAFLEVIYDGIIPICEQLEQAISDQIVRELVKLKNSATAPEKLLEAMRTLEPLHYGVLNFNVSKSRPPPQLQEASKSYVALRAQLAAELPRYLELLQQGIFAVIVTFVEWQREFWSALREKWGELWDALKVDGEMQGEAAETLRVWWSRFAEVEAQVHGLNIVRIPEKKERDRDKESRTRARARGRSISDAIETGSIASTIVASTLHTLDAPHTPYTPRSSASSQTLVSSPAGAKYGRQLDRRTSNESLHSKKSGRSASGKHRNNHSGTFSPHELAQEDYNARYEYYSTSTPVSPKPSYSRTKSMPISSPMPLQKSSSQGRLLDVGDGEESVHTLRTPTQAQSFAPGDGERGRPSRKPSMKRRVTDTFRPSSSSSKHRRSPSLPSMKALSPPPPQLSPSQSTFSGRSLVAKIPAMYACRVVHFCEPPEGVSYLDIPFFILRVGEVFDVLQEAGHPSTHKDLPLYVDDGEDCLLLVRDGGGEIGWALASFLIPVD